ncbi:MAG: hypothetical protein AAFQ82_07405, partial [Myxococcota bacterium]
PSGAMGRPIDGRRNLGLSRKKCIRAASAGKRSGSAQACSAGFAFGAAIGNSVGVTELIAIGRSWRSSFGARRSGFIIRIRFRSKTTS